MGAGSWEEVERGALRYAAYRSYARGRRRRDPMDHLDLTDRERAVAYLVALGLCGAVILVSLGLIYLTAIILLAIYRGELWDAMMTATGLFMLFLWPIPSLILLFILKPLVEKRGRGRAGEMPERGRVAEGD